MSVNDWLPRLWRLVTGHQRADESMWELCNEEFRRAMWYADQHAAELESDQIYAEHLLYAAIADEGGMALRVLAKLNVSREALLVELSRECAFGPWPLVSRTLDLRGRQLIESALNESRLLSNTLIGTEHILLATISVKDGLIGRILSKFTLDIDEAREATILVQGNPQRAWPSA